MRLCGSKECQLPTSSRLIVMDSPLRVQGPEGPETTLGCRTWTLPFFSLDQLFLHLFSDSPEVGDLLPSKRPDNLVLATGMCM
jgi:hypothetical protein